MHLSTRGRYAVAAMLELAALDAEGPQTLTLAQISDRQGISLSYLEQLFARLRRAGVVASVRGPGGGYRLNRAAAETWLADIINAVEEDIGVNPSASNDNPEERGRICVNGVPGNCDALWEALGRHIAEFMARVSLQMVLDGRLARPLAVREKLRVKLAEKWW
jgi:Rrf2 family iron-sulfur cluster assembly transcriptional regulator